MITHLHFLLEAYLTQGNDLSDCGDTSDVAVPSSSLPRTKPPTYCAETPCGMSRGGFFFATPSIEYHLLLSSQIVPAPCWRWTVPLVLEIILVATWLLLKPLRFISPCSFLNL